MTKQTTDSRQAELRRLMRDPLLTALSNSTGWTLLVAFGVILVFSIWWIWGLMTSISDAIPTSISASIDCDYHNLDSRPESLTERDPEGRVVRRSACKSASALSKSWQKQVDLYKYIGKSAITREDGTRPTLSFDNDQGTSDSGIERF